MKSKNDTKNIKSLVHRWLEKAVIGLDLCPFAKPVWQKGNIHFAVSFADTSEALLSDLADECLMLLNHPEIETSLLILPGHLQHFDDFNQFLGLADDLLDNLNWRGVFQIASFHPHYQFANTAYDDRENWTNRSPFPILHLLREASLSKAVDSYPSVDEIPVTNIKRLNNLDDEVFNQIFIETPSKP